MFLCHDIFLAGKRYVLTDTISLMVSFIYVLCLTFGEFSRNWGPRFICTISIHFFILEVYRGDLCLVVEQYINVLVSKDKCKWKQVLITVKFVLGKIHSQLD